MFGRTYNYEGNTVNTRNNHIIRQFEETDLTKTVKLALESFIDSMDGGEEDLGLIPRGSISKVQDVLRKIIDNKLDVRLTPREE
jgi:ribonuclease HIII